MFDKDLAHNCGIGFKGEVVPSNGKFLLVRNSKFILINNQQFVTVRDKFV